MNYVNGTWLKKTKIPEDHASYGVGQIIDEKINIKIKEIIESCAKGNFTIGSDEQIVGDFYASFVDINHRNKQGISLLVNDLNRIKAIKDYDELTIYFAYANKFKINTPLQLNIWPDLKDAKRWTVYIDQNGLGLPDKEYYFANDEHTQQLRQKYERQIHDVFKLLEIEDPSKAAKTVFSIEKRLAEKHMSKEEALHYSKLYNVLSTKKLQELMPTFNWKNYLLEAGLKDRDSLVVEMLDYTKSLNGIINSISIEDWKTYLTWGLVSAMYRNLSQDVYDIYFNFRKDLYGVESPKPLWEQGVDLVNNDLGQLVVKLYGKKHVSEKTIEKVEEMILNIKQVFRDKIQDADWMAEKTKIEAIKKLDKLSFGVVYQKKWKDYSQLEIKKNDCYGNKKRLSQFEYDHALDNLDKPIDKYENEIRINSGYYESSLNMFMLGAGYIVPPFYDENTDDAVNYGALGSVIGHEIGHAFDRIGSDFDSEGNARDWWTDQDKNGFDSLSKKMIDQYSKYEVLDSLFINGEYTLNENMADLTSVVVPLHVYKNTIEGSESEVIGGFTPIQRFFTGYAQCWMIKRREESLRRQIATDPHSPPKYRVNGIVRNIPEFYDAFNVEKGDSLYLDPVDRVKIW